MNAAIKQESLVLDMALEPKVEQPLVAQPMPAQLREFAADSPVAMILAAKQQGMTLDEIDRMMHMHMAWEDRRANQALIAAMADFKAENVSVIKDRFNAQYGTWYSSLGNIVNTVTPALSKFGLSAAWDHEQANGEITIICTISHKLGGSKTTHITLPYDTTGAKNKAQSIKSAMTYGKVCTYESACGLASSEGNADDDGAGTGGAADAEAEDRALKTRDEWINTLMGCKTDAALVRAFELAQADIVPLNRMDIYMPVKTTFSTRRKELRGQQQ